MSLSILKKKLRTIIKLSQYELLKELYNDREFTDYIIYLNTQEQLYNKGVNSKGERLDKIGGGYSAYTIMEKERKGQPTDRVTLKDTGDFYKTFGAILTSQYGGAIVIVADTMKDDTDLAKEWGSDIIGLTDESLGKVIEMAKKKIKIIVDREIKQAA